MVPLCLFDASDREKRLAGLSHLNTRLVPRTENVAKGGRFVGWYPCWERAFPVQAARLHALVRNGSLAVHPDPSRDPALVHPGARADGSAEK